MKDFELIKPGPSHEAAVMRYRDEEWEANHSHIPGSSALADHENYSDWLEKVSIEDSEETVSKGRVPSDLYIAYDKERDKVVGMIQLRHTLNDYLRERGGHIGYSVAPSERRQGYATAMLQKTLDKARELGIEEVLITCDIDNLGSASVIEKCGGVFESQAVDAENKLFKRYWITL